MKGGPCPYHGNRLFGGKWFCHFHDPDGKYQINRQRDRDIPGQMVFSDLSTSIELLDRKPVQRDHSDALHLFAPPSPEASRVAQRRTRAYRKWENRDV